MKKYNTIAVIGGTGKSGNYLVKELLERNYKVRLLVRNPEKSPPTKENLEIVFGDVLNPASIRELLKESDAVISTLGLGIPISQKTIFSETTKSIIEEFKRNNLKRYIVLSSLNVDTDLDDKGDFTKAATKFMYDNFPISTQDKQDEYDLLSNSILDWTIIRSSMIELTDQKTDYLASTIDCKGQKISASSLAEFLVDQLESTEYLKKAPFIWNK